MEVVTVKRESQDIFYLFWLTIWSQNNILFKVLQSVDRLEGKKLQRFNLKPSQSSKLTYFNNFLHHSNKPEAVLECVGWGGKAAQKGTW